MTDRHALFVIYINKEKNCLLVWGCLVKVWFFFVFRHFLL